MKANGERETWEETVRRVVDGNLALVDEKYTLSDERALLIDYMTNFKIIPAGRQLWASGVEGRQFLFNCHLSGWGERLSDHSTFTFMRLMEGGGVGANYSNKYLEKFDNITTKLNVQFTCSETHIDYAELQPHLTSSNDEEYDAFVWVEDSREGWADALANIIELSQCNALSEVTVRVDVSYVRPKGSALKTFGGHASGPLPLVLMLKEVSDVLNSRVNNTLDGLSAMLIDHYIAQCVVSGGNRRSARMSMMHWQDPQIFDFMEIKHEGEHWTTNISVEIDDAFWRALEANDTHAENVMHKIAEGMLHNGEPGFWNSSLSNVGEPNTVIGTNPCGEIALEEWENCNLGHVNLAAFVDENGVIDYEELAIAHSLMTRFLMRATFGDVRDAKQREVLNRNRRIGVGHLGFASMVAMTGRKYSDVARDQDIVFMLRDMSAIVDFEANDFAFQLRIPVPVKTRTVAPTGSIAKLPGVSEGIHPIFAPYFIRRIRFSTIIPEQRDRVIELMNQGYKVEEDAQAPNTMVVEFPMKDLLVEEVEKRWGEDAVKLVQGASDLTLEQMLRVQAVYQQHWADNAVSFTANVDPANYSVSDIVEVLKRVGPELKGATVFPEKSFVQPPYSRLTEDEFKRYTTSDVGDGIDENCATGACPVR